MKFKELRFQFRSYTPDDTKIRFIVTDLERNVIEEVVVKKPFPRFHDFWSLEEYDPSVVNVLRNIVN